MGNDSTIIEGKKNNDETKISRNENLLYNILVDNWRFSSNGYTQRTMTQMPEPLDKLVITKIKPDSVLIFVTDTELKNGELYYKYGLGVDRIVDETVFEYYKTNLINTLQEYNNPGILIAANQNKKLRNRIMDEILCEEYTQSNQAFPVKPNSYVKIAPSEKTTHVAFGERRTSDGRNAISIALLGEDKKGKISDAFLVKNIHYF